MIQPADLVMRGLMGPFRSLRVPHARPDSTWCEELAAYKADLTAAECRTISRLAAAIEAELEGGRR